jgi:hypothetical protein
LRQSGQYACLKVYHIDYQVVNRILAIFVMSENERKKWLDINPKREPLTVEKLRQILKKEDLLESQANEILYGLEVLTNILIEFQTEQEQLKKVHEENNLKRAA